MIETRVPPDVRKLPYASAVLISKDIGGESTLIPLRSPSPNATDWVKAFSSDSTISVEPILVAKNVVPDLLGMGAKDAVFLVEKMGLSVQVQGRGKLISQSIKAGYAARKGSPIILKFE